MKRNNSVNRVSNATTVNRVIIVNRSSNVRAISNAKNRVSHVTTVSNAVTNNPLLTPMMLKTCRLSKSA